MFVEQHGWYVLSLPYSLVQCDGEMLLFSIPDKLTIARLLYTEIFHLRKSKKKKKRKIKQKQKHNY